MIKRRCLFYVIVGITVAFMIKAGEPNMQGKIPDHFKDRYFEMITVTETNLCIKFKSFGVRYLYRKNDGPLTKSEYGTTITVSVGESLTIIDRHSSITFAPLPEAIKHHGFEVVEEIDLRSFGKELKTNKVFMVTSEIKGIKDVKDRDIVFLEPSTNAVEEFLKKSIASQPSTNSLTK